MWEVGDQRGEQPRHDQPHRRRPGVDQAAEQRLDVATADGRVHLPGERGAAEQDRRPAGDAPVPGFDDHALPVGVAEVEDDGTGEVAGQPQGDRLAVVTGRGAFKNGERVSECCTRRGELRVLEEQAGEPVPEAVAAAERDCQVRAAQLNSIRRAVLGQEYPVVLFGQLNELSRDRLLRLVFGGRLALAHAAPPARTHCSRSPFGG